MEPVVPGTRLPIRYVGLDHRMRAAVSEKLLKRLGKWSDTPRFLTYAEAQQLEDEDFNV